MCSSVWKWSRPNVNVQSGGGALERRVDDARDAGGHGGVDGAAVQRHAVGVLGGRHEQQRVDPVERGAQAAGIVVALEGGDLGVGQVGRPRGVADEQALGHAVVGEARGHAAAEAAGRAGHGDGPVHRSDPTGAAGPT